jgi:hypothetical protein
MLRGRGRVNQGRSLRTHVGAFVFADVRVKSDESNLALGKIVQACANATLECRGRAAGG